MIKNLPQHINAYKLIYLGALIHVFFYVSVAWTGWFDVFFSGAALHSGAKGIDFYQLPRGAWAFWHGGQLTGDPLSDGSRYAKTYFANGNVYHPLFTLMLGSFLMLFDPAVSPYVWLWIKLVVSLLLAAYFFWNFRDSKYVQFAVFVLQINGSIYLELAAWQFHFVLNVFLLLFLIGLVKKQPVLWNTVTYWLGMLVKPMEILFIPILLAKGRWKVALLGSISFVLVTWLLHDIGKYYIDNLVANILQSGELGPNQIITFNALLHYGTHWPKLAYMAIQYGVLLLVVCLGLFRRIHISKAIFLMVAYYLCFYNQVFEYQWSTLAYAIAICVVLLPEFQTWPARCCILLTCLPSCFILLDLLHIDVKDMGYLGLIPGVIAWQWMVVSKLLPLFLLCGCVLAPDIKPIYKQLRAFLVAMNKVNDHLEVFGDGEEEKKPLSLESSFMYTDANRIMGVEDNLDATGK